MRPYSFRCGWFRLHKYDEVDDCNRISCSRCAKRKPVRFETIQAPEAVGRELNRPKTRGAKR
jgi:hypothetical protein